MSDALDADVTANPPCHRSSKIAEAQLDAKRRELGVADELEEIPGITASMLVTLGEQGIKSIEDLANCATDDLFGWIEEGAGKVTRHKGILHRFWISRRECEAMIVQARISAGWIEQT
jgi:transcription termination/antitermination protein NusA